MPIDDPGNAGTASEPERVTYVANGQPQRVFPTSAQEDQRRRAMALALACITSLTLFPAIIATLITQDWLLLAVGFLGWLALTIMAAGIVTYRHGSGPRR